MSKQQGRAPAALTSVVAAVLTALTLVACGKNKDFATKSGSVPTPTPETEVSQVPAARGPVRPAAGFQAPNVQGSGVQVLDAGGKLGDPVDPDETAEVTTIEGGDPTKIGMVKSPVTDETSALTCPSGLLVAGTCVGAVDVLAWRPSTATNNASVLVSTRGESCTEAGNPVCSLLKSKATALGYKVTGAAFRALNEADATKPSVAGLTMALQICHGSRVAEGSERITDTTSSCSTEQEFIWGLRAAQTGTIPLFRWQASGFHVLSTSNTVPPAPGFSLNPAAPLLHVLPPLSR